jgi:hypothetical protein
MKASVVRAAKNKQISIITKMRKVQEEILEAEELYWMCYGEDVNNYFSTRIKYLKGEYEKLNNQLLSPNSYTSRG